MKSILKFFLQTIFGSIALVLLLAVIAVLLLLIPDGEPVFGEKQAKAIYTEQKVAFETVRQFIDGFDLTPYKVEGESAPNILIERDGSEDSEKTYHAYVYRGDEIPIVIENESVTQALDVLFDQIGIVFIVQLREPNERNIYFAIKEKAGVVYSENGEMPTDTPAGVPYYIKPIEGSWFYWLYSDD